MIGAGTGTVGFEGATVGPGNNRLLLQDTHFLCGEEIEIAILDDGSDIDEENEGTARIGLGSIQIDSAG